MVSVAGNNLTVFGCSMTLIGLLLSSGAVKYFFSMGSRTTTTEKTTNENKRAINDLTSFQQNLVQKMEHTTLIAADAQARIARIEPSVQDLQTAMARQETIVNEIRRQFGKLDRVDEINAKVTALCDTVNNVMQNALVPRPELNRQFDNDDKRFKRLEEDVRDLYIHKGSNPSN